jgi:hypothetical protein
MQRAATTTFTAFRRTFASNSNPKVFFDVKIGAKPAGRMVFEVGSVCVSLLVVRSHPTLLDVDSCSPTSCPRPPRTFASFVWVTSLPRPECVCVCVCVRFQPDLGLRNASVRC